MKRKIAVLFLALVTTCEVLAQTVEQMVEIVTPDGMKLKGTLLLPLLEQKEAFPIALIIAGSGPTDRNGNNPLMLNNSLKLVAEGLATAGIASLRYDKRGVGASRNNTISESELTMDTYADDVISWVEYINNDPRITDLTLIGHSEGARLALRAINNGADVEHVVLLAGAGRSLDVILKEQLSDQPEQIKELSYAIIDTLKKGKTYDSVPVFLNSLFRHSVQPALIAEFQVKPSELATNVTIPMLIVQGTTDIQITIQDAKALSAANHDAELVIIENMNHVLKECVSTDKQTQTSYYSNPNIPLHPKLMPVINNFILNHPH